MKECLLSELEFRTSRSSGPGGQHVNTTETRVELRWDPARSTCLGPVQKERLLKFLSPRLSDQGLLILSSEKFRSQAQNRQEVIDRFLRLVRAGITPVKPRKPTRPTQASQERRLRQKKIRGQIKRIRREKPGE
jgi:ribosome-associated protein